MAAAEHRDEDTWECIYWMLASKVYPLTTPLLTLRKDSELGKQQHGRRHPVMEIFFIQHQGKEVVSFLSRRRLQQLILEGKSSSRRCTKLSYKAEVTPSQPKWSWLVRRNSKPCNLLLMSESDTVAQPRYFSLGWSSLGRQAL